MKHFQWLIFGIATFTSWTVVKHLQTVLWATVKLLKMQHKTETEAVCLCTSLNCTFWNLRAGAQLFIQQQNILSFSGLRCAFFLSAVKDGWVLSSWWLAWEARTPNLVNTITYKWGDVVFSNWHHGCNEFESRGTLPSTPRLQYFWKSCEHNNLRKTKTGHLTI